MQDEKRKIIDNFDANGVLAKGRLFGLPFDEHFANVIILPVPWEVTVSYNEGTAQAPDAILNASIQLDLFKQDIKNAWKTGIYMLPISQSWKRINDEYRQYARQHIHELEQRKSINAQILQKTNAISEQLNQWVNKSSQNYLLQNKIVGVLGGDHSTPLGLMQALATKYNGFGILQIDAHADLRKEYEGFAYSHASIMYNAIKIDQVAQLTQVGIRDFCKEEYDTQQNNLKIKAFTDDYLQESLFEGKTWKSICQEIIQSLPEYVYISFDVDGLMNYYAPNTGTPVPSGLSFAQANYLVKLLVQSKRKIIGFDVCEVVPHTTNEWDANVGARLLYNLSIYAALSQQLI